MKGSCKSIDFIRNTLSFLFFFNFIVTQVFAAPSRHLCRPEQRDALINFKNEFNIYKPCDYPEFPKTESWTDNSDCCSWDGVTCDANFGYVIELNLNSSCLTGQLNSRSNIFRLQNFRLLNFSYNYFSGQISSSFGNLSKLITFDISCNNLNGQIPSSFGNFSHLKFFYLFINNLTGEIPSDFGRLNKLVKLDLGYNKLNGNFPLILLNLTGLSYLAISNNQLTGMFPPNMSSLSNLEFFFIDYNAFTRTLPPSLFAIPNISRIFVNDNQLNSTLEFGNISSSLFTLRLGKNNFRGPIPRSIVKLVNLEELDLSYLNTQGSVDLSIFSHFKSLRYLYLSHLNTTTTFDLNEIFSYFNYLESLDLSGNHVSADIKDLISGHPLMYLHLSRCGLTNFPEFIKNQHEMFSLNISNNEIKGQVPGWLWSLLNLELVDLSSNKFTGFEKPTNPRRASTQEPRMRFLFGSNNNFTGKIPYFICGLPSLKALNILDLSNNEFSGSIPRCLGNFSMTLEVLDLEKNHLSGGLPENLSKSLLSLDIGHNQLVGKLPRSLVYISSLEVLNVESNKFSDTFPFWLKCLQKLQVLVLRSNAFHGPIQKVGFSQLRIIDISGNHFNGTLPSDFFVN